MAAMLSCMVLTFIFREVMKDGEERWGEALGYWDAIWREVGLLNPPGDFSLDLNSWHLDSESEWQPDGTQPCAHTISVLKGKQTHIFFPKKLMVTKVERKMGRNKLGVWD